MSTTGLAGEFRKIITGAQTGLQFCRLPVRPQVQSGTTDTELLPERSRKYTYTAIPTGLSGPAIHVLDRSANTYRKTNSPRPTAYDTHTVAFQNNWTVLESMERSFQFPGPCTPINYGGKEKTINSGQPLHPIKHALKIFTDT